MAHQEDTLRGPKFYHESPQRQVRQHGADELAAEPVRGNARHDPRRQQENRRKMGVNDSHRTETMERRRRGTYP